MVKCAGHHAGGHVFHLVLVIKLDQLSKDVGRSACESLIDLEKATARRIGAVSSDRLLVRHLRPPAPGPLRQALPTSHDLGGEADVDGLLFVDR
jgi:hypothetical protein